ncbi:MAG: class I SAM-dependent methyltransferase [Ideonella sp.]|nr:class I SAM-dependent methyltransferase [Ideonella sp.]
MQSFWNERFAAPGYKYGTAPNAFLVEQAATWPAQQTVLAVGDGEGRNGVWLAEQGHQVLAVDYAQAGLDKALALAQQHGVPNNRYCTLCADLATWQPAPESAEAVVLIYCHLASALRRPAHRHLARSLKPGGMLVLEAFHPLQKGRPSGGPQDVDMLYTLVDLRADFAGVLEEVLGWEGEVLLDEGPGHQGHGWVTRWTGRRADPRASLTLLNRH